MIDALLLCGVYLVFVSAIMVLKWGIDNRNKL